MALGTEQEDMVVSRTFAVEPLRSNVMPRHGFMKPTTGTFLDWSHSLFPTNIPR